MQSCIVFYLYGYVEPHKGKLMTAMSNNDQNSKFDKHERLNEHIKSLEDWGMPQSDLKQIMWEWNQGKQIWEFHNSPHKIVAMIEIFLSQYENSNLPNLINSLSVKL